MVCPTEKDLLCIGGKDSSHCERIAAGSDSVAAEASMVNAQFLSPRTPCGCIALTLSSVIGWPAELY